MPNYRRWRIDGGIYFFTVVTHQRRAIFAGALSRQLLREAIVRVRCDNPFDLRAIVMLPDHLHMLWCLPQGDMDYSTRIAVMKKRFTDTYLAAGGKEGGSTPSRLKHRLRGIWQKRFYEHSIRDYADFKRHLDYIHSNPVKHGFASMPKDWPYSSFHRYVCQGQYDLNWCGHVKLPGGADIEPDDWA